MIKHTQFITAFVSGVLFYSSVAHAQDKPGLSLFTFSGEHDVTYTAQDPLLLFVSIENAAARIIRRRNQRNQELLEQFFNTDDYKAFSEQERSALANDYPILEMPKITLGSESSSLENLITFRVNDPNSQAIELDIRPLASNQHAAIAIDLPENETLLYRFVADRDQLKTLPSGTMSIAANIDTTKQKEMWQGTVASNNISVTLASPHPDSSWDGSNQQAMLHSAFLVEDQRYQDAETHALDWIKQHPNSVDAWGQLGEALLGQGKKTEALEAFTTAIAKFRLKNGNSPIELPDELLDRISEIEQG